MRVNVTPVIVGQRNPGASAAPLSRPADGQEVLAPQLSSDGEAADILVDVICDVLDLSGQVKPGLPSARGQFQLMQGGLTIAGGTQADISNVIRGVNSVLGMLPKTEVVTEVSIVAGLVDLAWNMHSREMSWTTIGLKGLGLFFQSAAGLAERTGHPAIAKGTEGLAILVKTTQGAHLIVPEKPDASREPQV